MSVYEVISSTNGKCVSCRFYKQGESFMIGRCTSEETKVKSKNRFHNSKACSVYDRSNKEINEKYGEQ